MDGGHRYRRNAAVSATKYEAEERHRLVFLRNGHDLRRRFAIDTPNTFKDRDYG